MDMSLELLGPLYGTMYLIPWLRMLGAKIGRKAEVSTARSASPDLLDVADESFIADAVSLGTELFDGGWMRLGRTCVGRRAFVGNGAMLAGDVTIGENTLIGVLSVASAESAVEGTSWLGSPAFLLPRRQVSTAFPAANTFEPTAGLFAQRAIIEFLRVTLPATVGTLVTIGLINILLILRRYFGGMEVVMLFPVVFGGMRGFGGGDRCWREMDHDGKICFG